MKPFFVVPCHSFSLLVTFLFTFLVIPSHSLIIHSISHCYLSFLIPDVMLSCHSFSSSLSYLERLLETITGECTKSVANQRLSNSGGPGDPIFEVLRVQYFRSEMKWYAFRVSFAARKKEWWVMITRTRTRMASFNLLIIRRRRLAAGNKPPTSTTTWTLVHKKTTTMKTTVRGYILMRVDENHIRRSLVAQLSTVRH